MSLRQVLTIYNTERQLSDDETALLNTLRKMTDAERGMFVDGLSDKPQKKSSERVIERCNICNYTRRAKHHSDQTQRDYHEFEAPQSSKKSAGGGGGRSSRGTSIKNQLSNRRQEQPTPTYCAHVSDDGDDPTQCGESESSGIHDATMGYRNYHPFQPPATTAASGGGG